MSNDSRALPGGERWIESRVIADGDQRRIRSGTSDCTFP